MCAVRLWTKGAGGRAGQPHGRAAPQSSAVLPESTHWGLISLLLVNFNQNFSFGGFIGNVIDLLIVFFKCCLIHLTNSQASCDSKVTWPWPHGL